MALGLQRAEEEDISRVIGRVKRAMPRNLDVQAVCEFAESLMVQQQAKETRKRESRAAEAALERTREKTRLRVQRFRERQANGK